MGRLKSVRLFLGVDTSKHAPVSIVNKHTKALLQEHFYLVIMK